MRKTGLVCVLILSVVLVTGQVADMHAHLTNKHFMKDKAMPEKVIKYIERTGKLPPRYLKNWEQRLKPKRMRKGDSNFGNYFQTTYSGLQNGNYKIAVHSISPWESNLFHDANYYFRNIMRIAGPFASHIPVKRFKTVIKTPPFTEAYSEFLYTTNQSMNSPGGNFRMYFPRNADSLEAHINDPNTCIAIMSYEGGHILFGKTVMDEKGFLETSLSEVEKDEVRANIQFLKEKSTHKTFFITPVHFLWNTFAGQAKALDKIEIRNLVSFLFRSRALRKKLSSKFGSGLPPVTNVNDRERKFVDTATCSCPGGNVRTDNSCFKYAPTIDTFGKEVIQRLLDPRTSTPVYIDVKHMDVRSRVDYYILHDSLEKVWKIKIPIIYSHGAVSGEKLKVAYHTSVTPLLDRYAEVKDPKKFYATLLRESKNYNCGLVKDYALVYEGAQSMTARISENDFKLTNSLDDSTTAGWFYPWSINLFDEEIKKIYDSDGIIGVMLDERTLGWNLPNYQDDKYKKWLAQALAFRGFLQQNNVKEQLDSFRIAEAFLRNVFYIIKHSGRKDSTAWDHIGLGSDFDGFINPIDICKTADEVPGFKQYLISVIPIFLAIHKEYQLEGEFKNLLFGLQPETALNKLFLENTSRFIEKYFDKTVPLTTSSTGQDLK